MTHSSFNTARAAGLAYLGIAVAAIYAELFVRGTMVVSGDVAATIANITAGEFAYRAGIIADILVLVLEVPLALWFWQLFHKVNRNWAAVALVLNLLRIPIMAPNLMNHFAPLQALSGIAELTPLQVETMVLLALDSHEKAYVLAHWLFGSWCFAIGVLVWKSGFLPRLLGVLMMSAVLGYVADLLVTVLAPGLRGAWVDALLALSGIAEISLALWLAIMGGRVWRKAHTAQGETA
ncbi:MAG: DUF4386 domain-containing protein [Paracoccaceae bacterium]